jgi:hypothetical protein
LIDHLKCQGIRNPSGGKKLQQLCVYNGLPTHKQEPKIIKGWIEKAKGSLQILYECRSIDTTRLGDYTIAGKKVAYGQLRVNTSL